MAEVVQRNHSHEENEKAFIDGIRLVVISKVKIYIFYLCYGGNLQSFVMLIIHLLGRHSALPLQSVSQL